jgi:hypothetical protein
MQRKVTFLLSHDVAASIGSVVSCPDSWGPLINLCPTYQITKISLLYEQIGWWITEYLAQGTVGYETFHDPGHFPKAKPTLQPRFPTLILLSWSFHGYVRPPNINKKQDGHFVFTLTKIYVMVIVITFGCTHIYHDIF